ncbi:MAG: aspartate kinase [Aquificaceae bacterium]|nr:aspartate kinase [Aquificaceae bacterium]MDW8237289.1 aspartate kinase [Aquificaceae bacterium]
MKTVVLKFGGTSVGDLSRIENAARRVINKLKEGKRVVVVTSAMAGETDSLLSLASQTKGNLNPREVDALISIGEQKAASLFAIVLQRLGYRAKSFCGWQLPIYTDSVHTKARILSIQTERVLRELENDVVPVVTGFQGVSKEGDITTLGRGGSDLSAVALSHALFADCEIYTDVEGVFSADPRLVKNAKKIDRISYEEMLEMASLGAKVMQARSIEYAMKYGVRIHVRSSFSENEGTWILPEEEVMEKPEVRAITLDRNESRITLVGVEDRPGIAYEVFSALGNSHIVVDMIVQNVSHQGFTDLSFTVNRNEQSKAFEIVKEVAKKIGVKDVVLDDKIAKISVVGIGMRSSYGTAAKVFEVLYKLGINIMAISTSEIKISCLIEEKYGELALRELHQVFIEQ